MNENKWSIINPLIFAGIFFLFLFKYNSIKDYLTLKLGISDFQLIFGIIILALGTIYFLKKGGKVMASSQRSMSKGNNPLIFVVIFALLIISYPKITQIIEERTSLDPTIFFIILTAVVIYGVYAYSKY